MMMLSPYMIRWCHIISYYNNSNTKYPITWHSLSFLVTCVWLWSNDRLPFQATQTFKHSCVYCLLYHALEQGHLGRQSIRNKRTPEHGPSGTRSFSNKQEPDHFSNTVTWEQDRSTTCSLWNKGQSNHGTTSSGSVRPMLWPQFSLREKREVGQANALTAQAQVCTGTNSL